MSRHRFVLGPLTARVQCILISRPYFKSTPRLGSPTSGLSVCQPWLCPASHNLANRRFAIVAEVDEGRLQANYFCCGPTRVCAVLFHVSCARFCGRGGCRQKILTRCGEVLEVLLDATRDPALTERDLTSSVSFARPFGRCRVSSHGV